jgi:very-short-patch-repair endonuclease
MQRHRPTISGKGKESAGHFLKSMTEGEKMLLPPRPGKAMRGVPFYRQNSMGYCIVDFSAPKANLVVKEDGLRHKRTVFEKNGKGRDGYLSTKGIEVQQLNANEVVREIDSVNQRIYETVKEKLR